MAVFVVTTVIISSFNSNTSLFNMNNENYYDFYTRRELQNVNHQIANVNFNILDSVISGPFVPHQNHSSAASVRLFRFPARVL